MNKLESTILSQHERIRQAGPNGHEVLADTQDEIMGVADIESTAEILGRRGLRVHARSEAGSSRAYMRRALHHDHLVGIANRSLERLKELESQRGIILPHQGFMGGVALEGHEAVGVFGFAPKPNDLSGENDPIQEAMGDVFYPPMMWVKALRSEAYNNRPDSMKDLTVSQYLATIGLSQGSAPAGWGNVLLGATGFMPGPMLAGLEHTAPFPIGDHIADEEVEAFKLSGFCDQAVVDPEFMRNPTSSMLQVIFKGGSLN